MATFETATVWDIVYFHPLIEILLST